MLKEVENNSVDNEIENREWFINVIVGIRQEVLIKLRTLNDSIDREKYTAAQREAIGTEIREIAEMVSEKDANVKKREELKKGVSMNCVKEDSLVDIVRKRAIEQLHEIKAGILAVENDIEYPIIVRELEEIEHLIKDKDMLIHSKVPNYYKGGTQNPYLSKYFKMDDAPEIE